MTMSREEMRREIIDLLSDYRNELLSDVNAAGRDRSLTKPSEDRARRCAAVIHQLRGGR